MSDRPILFSAPMVRALLDGRKSMTRRVLRLPKKTHTGGAIYERADMGGWEATTTGGCGVFSIGPNGERIAAPEKPAIWHRTCGVYMSAPYQVGDRLWCRETWALELQETGGAPVEPKRVLYAATDSWEGPAVPSIHMPRWASRLTLIVTGVKIERLNGISCADAIAEGIRPAANSQTIDCDTPDPRREFANLWNSINGDGAWEANPWVVAITFRTIKANIDAQAARAG